MPRDPEKTARNRRIAGLSAQLQERLPDVLEETGIESIQSLNGIYGGKFAVYIDITNQVIHSAEHFVSLYLEGFIATAKRAGVGSADHNNLDLLRRSPKLKEFLFLFLQRVYFRNFDALSKKRPAIQDSEVWIGQNNASYGLLITPRFSGVSGEWENDKSEIRHFRPRYWSVGHVMATGLVIPGKNECITFETIEKYLDFFVNVLVRNSGSPHEYELATLYRSYVLSAPDPTIVPLLIPEYRYDGSNSAHKYRLDFTIIDPFELTKIGFELSPWSTHGYLSGVKSKTQLEINEQARSNFEKEMRKHKDFFRRHGVFALIYTDSDLADLQTVFLDIAKYLEPQSRPTQLRLHIIEEILGTAP